MTLRRLLNQLWGQAGGENLWIFGGDEPGRPLQQNLDDHHDQQDH